MSRTLPRREADEAVQEAPSYRRRRDAEDERVRSRRDASTRERGSAWERSGSAVETTARPPREHVSAYLDESSVVRVTRRGDRSRRRQEMAEEEPQPTRERRSPRGFSLVEDEPERETRQAETRRSRRAEPTWPTEGSRELAYEEPVRRMAGFADDYDYRSEGISGSQSRRQAVVDALLFVPEAIGSAILEALSHVHLRGLMVVCGIALTVAMLYNPVRNLYLANRRLDTLQETYDALLAQNEEIQHELEVLQTREGIENEARARGYVEPGETKVLVEGLPQEEATGTGVFAITEERLPDNRPWYIRVLDELFGYHPEG